MAAFSYEQHLPFLLDSVCSPTKLSGFMEEGNIFDTNCFSPFYLPDPWPETTLLDHSSKLAVSEDNEPSSVIRKQSTESSIVVDKIESGEQVTQNVSQMRRKRKSRNGSSLNPDPSKDAREGKSKKQKKNNGSMNDEEKDPKTDDQKEQNKSSEEPPKGYIHVRARRGQATDSHSLAERVRREKISERMKILQQLVPGCDKVTGKALILDEIINYVQSLQNQVEFLSLKLSSLNPLFYDFGMDTDAFMVRPDQRLNCMASPLPPLQQCSLTQATAFADTTTAFIPPNSFPLVEASPSLLLQSQPNGDVMWDVDDQRQRLLSSSGFNDNLCSFH
ncbi:hypothetical protein SLEP1_g27921 [Rubroshorea leprosula]|uniref:BHLH domain-containing protein n=1 Tax=Rubroshorea leprosula TaxID=152421 RepID=A0AAV5JXI5_9ROSI|nr:hypothetical protein SLEP1_g27921 [Rubroshorea leprosula]